MFWAVFFARFLATWAAIPVWYCVRVAGATVCCWTWGRGAGAGVWPTKAKAMIVANMVPFLDGPSSGDLKLTGPIARNPERQGRHDPDASPAVSDASMTSMLFARSFDCKQ